MSIAYDTSIEHLLFKGHQLSTEERYQRLARFVLDAVHTTPDIN